MAAPTVKAHAKFSASGSERWLECPGSVQLTEKAPPEKDSPYAAEGTTAHELFERLQRAHLNPMNLRDTQRLMESLRAEYPPEMYEHCWEAFLKVKELHHALGEDTIWLCETKVSLEFVAPDMFGTVDTALVEEFGTLYVIDFKYGAGVTVEVEGNSQLIYYALGIAHQYGFCFKDVVLMVIQPRAYSDEGPVRSHRMSIEELMSWEEKFRDGVEKVQLKNPPLHGGPHCRWCRAKPICPEISEKPLRAARLLNAKDKVDVYELAPSDIRRLPELLDAAEKLEFWIASVKAFAHDTLERGGHVEGWKLVDKRATRRWTDEAAAAEEAELLFGDAAFSRTFLSPSQIEKAIPGSETKVWTDEHCRAVSSGVTMVRERDKREAVNIVHEQFQILDDQDVKPQKTTKTVKKRYSDPSPQRRPIELDFDVLDV